jgi:hypothetical protein
MCFGGTIQLTRLLPRTMGSARLLSDFTFREGYIPSSSMCQEAFVQSLTGVVVLKRELYILHPLGFIVETIKLLQSSTKCSH